jgi:hypothetical protein
MRLMWRSSCLLCRPQFLIVGDRRPVNQTAGCARV